MPWSSRLGQATPPKVRWSTNRSSVWPSAKENRACRCFSSRASRRLDEELAAHPEVHQQALVVPVGAQTPARGTCRVCRAPVATDCSTRALRSAAPGTWRTTRAPRNSASRSGDRRRRPPGRGGQSRPPGSSGIPDHRDPTRTRRSGRHVTLGSSTGLGRRRPSSVARACSAARCSASFLRARARGRGPPPTTALATNCCHGPGRTRRRGTPGCRARPGRPAPGLVFQSGRPRGRDWVISGSKRWWTNTLASSARKTGGRCR